MILTCPSCSATYNVPAEALGEKGRDVRCKKCAHTWFQKSEKDALSELIQKIQSSDIPEDDISFGDGAAYSKSLKKKEKKKLSERLAGLLKSIKAKFSALYEKVRAKFLVRFAPLLPYLEKLKVDPKTLAGCLVGLALFSVVFYGIVASRFALSDVFPSLRPVYVSAGFPLVSYDPHVSPEEALIIERAQLVKSGEGGHSGKIVANLINLSASEVFLPTLYIKMIDSHGQVLKEEHYHFPAQSILKEKSMDVSVPVSEELMSGLSTVEMSFEKVEEGVAESPDEVHSEAAQKSTHEGTPEPAQKSGHTSEETSGAHH